MMARKRTAALFVTAALFTLSLLLLPIVLQDSPPLCDEGASAQEGEACADENATIEAQDLTLGAYQVIAAQATVDVANHKATITALEAACNIEPTPAPGLPFADNFTDNSQGWVVTEDQNTAVNIIEGQLFVGANEFWFVPALVPNLHATEFYAEVTATTPYDESIFLGFAMGNGEITPSQYELVLVGSDWNEETNEFNWYVRHYQWDGFNLTVQAEAAYAPFWQAGEPVQLGLEAKEGQYMLLINGFETQTYQFVPPGDQLGLVIYAPDNALDELRYAYYDNLSITASRESTAEPE